MRCASPAASTPSVRLVLLAVLTLGERVQAAGWIGVVGGFIGVLLVMRPEFKSLDSGSLWAVDADPLAIGEAGGCHAGLLSGEPADAEQRCQRRPDEQAAPTASATWSMTAPRTAQRRR